MKLLLGGEELDEARIANEQAIRLYESLSATGSAYETSILTAAVISQLLRESDEALRYYQQYRRLIADSYPEKKSQIYLGS